MGLSDFVNEDLNRERMLMTALLELAKAYGKISKSFNIIQKETVRKKKQSYKTIYLYCVKV